jgi:hypothetical protein
MAQREDGRELRLSFQNALPWEARVLVIGTTAAVALFGSYDAGLATFIPVLVFERHSRLADLAPLQPTGGKEKTMSPRWPNISGCTQGRDRVSVCICTSSAQPA